MKTTIFKTIIAVGSLVILSGCASPLIQSTGVNESTYKSESVATDHKLHRNVSVETSGFLETTINTLSKQSKPNLNNEDAKKAIEDSLEHAGMLADSESEYVLKATLVDADLGNIFVNKATKREITIQYILSSLFSSNLYDNIITGLGENEYKLFTADNYGREKRASEKAYKDNFRQLVEDLKKL